MPSPHPSAQPLDTVLRASPGIVYAMAIEGERLRPTLFGPNFGDLLDWRADDCLRRQNWWLDSIHPDDRNTVRQAIPGLLRCGHWSVEYRLAAADGSYRSIHDSATVVDAADGRWVSGVWLDIGDQPRQPCRHSKLLDTLSRADAIIFGATDLNRVMSELLDLSLALFQADRAWLLHPCDQLASHWEIPMERTAAGWDGAFALGEALPMTPDIAASFATALSGHEPVLYGRGCDAPVPHLIRDRFKVKSRIIIAVRPPIGAPWLFGLHYCADSHIFSSAEVERFQALGERIGDALGTLLLMEQLEDRQQRHQLLFEQAPVSLWEEDASAVKDYIDAIRARGVEDIEAYLQDHPEEVIECSKRIQVLDVNHSTLELYGAKDKQELLGNLDKTLSDQSMEVFREELLSFTNGQFHFTADAQTQTLRGQPLEIRARIAIAPDCEHDWSRMLVAVTDITAQKRAETEIQHLNRTLRLVGGCSQALMRADSEEQLFDAICQEIVEEAGYRMASICLIDQAATNGVRTVACTGASDCYLNTAATNNADDGARHPARAAIDTRSAVVHQHCSPTPACHHCLQQGSQPGVASTLTLPIIDRQRVFGVLNICSAEPAAFPPAELELLGEFAGDVAYGIRVLRDRIEQEATHNYLQALYDASPDMIFIHAPGDRIVDVNDHVPRTFGYPDRATLLATPIEQLMGIGYDYHEIREKIQQARDGIPCDFDWVARRLDGRNFDVEVRLRRLDARGRVLALVRDISQRKSLQARLAQQAYYDELTGLPNRRLALERMSLALSIAKRDERSAALMLLDLDNFKQVNDTHGHGTGDRLLIGVAERLNTAVRSSDTVARLGGDEFLVLMTDIGDQDEVLKLADKILRLLDRAMVVDGHSLVVSTSIGIARYPNDGDNADTLLKAADSAMYKAKQEGRNTYRFFSAELNQRMERYMQLGTALRQAVRQNQLQVFYQPVVESDGSPVGVEALLRWQHPRWGWVSPAEFIPVAEDCGLIVDMGRRVLEQACQQLHSWHQQGLPLRWVSVNLSPRQFWKHDLGNTVTEVLQSSGLTGEFLKLEITEGLLLDHPPEALTTLEQLRALGVRLALDDFGTGYSSLSYLKRYPFDSLKIDRSFVENVVSDHDDLSLTRTIISMARCLDLQVIAEGVETEQTAQLLTSEGCDLLQGYLYSKALPATALEAWIGGRR